MVSRVIVKSVTFLISTIFMAEICFAVDPLDQATPKDNIDESMEVDVAEPASPKSQYKIAPVVMPKPIEAPKEVAPVSASDPLLDVPELSNNDDDIPLGSFSASPLENDFAGAPPLPGTVRALADGEAPEDYTIEEGDTLIDICDQLLDEPGYWPKLWSLNPEIKNPHFIFPLMRLRFYPGDDDVPPYLQVVTEEEVVPIDKDDLEENQLISEQIDQSARNINQRREVASEKGGNPEKLVMPVVKAFQRVFSEIIGVDQVDELAELPMMGGKVFLGTTMSVSVPIFIYGEEVDPMGVVLAGRLGQFSVGQGDEVIVEAEKGLQAGVSYTILRDTGKVYSTRTDEKVGYRYEYVAQIRLERDVGEGKFRGIIKSSRLGVQTDDILVPNINIDRIIPSEDNPTSTQAVQGSIISWENLDQENGGRGNYAVIDLGRNGNVAVGSNLAVYSTPGYLIGELSSLSGLIDYKLTGIIRIIDVTDVAAVGYVINNTSELRIGDLTYKP